jgi:beta-glucosidase
LANEYILRRTVKTCDYIGVNYYNHFHIGILGRRKTSHSKHETTDMGWSIHPEGLERVLLYVQKFGKPIYITENGLADAKDEKREKFIKDHLFYVHQAMQKGADVRGYLYWSLTDNFEWQHGFWPRFGLVEIDRESLLKRKVRYSALKYAEICKNNFFEY